MTMRNPIFAAAYILIHTTPFAVVAVFVLGTIYPAVDGWAWLLALAVVYAPAYLYLLTRRCSHCGQPLYTTEHLKTAPGGWRRIPLYVYDHCPECGREVFD